MNKKCPKCRLVNYLDAEKCDRCDAFLNEYLATVTSQSLTKKSIPLRAVICFAVCLSIVIGFYLSLIISSKSLDFQQKNSVSRSIDLIKTAGFETEASLLGKCTVYRATDNWFNSLVPKENAYAATNFPFEIMTLYADFFTYPIDETERSAILLHEARHLRGGGEQDAYEFVWKNRARLGWTKDKYSRSPVWRNVRNQTREYAPALFTCEGADFNDCTE